MISRSLALTVRLHGGKERVEQYDANTLIDPRDVGKRHSQYCRMTVTTQHEAEEWGRALVDFFNMDTRFPRTFVSAELGPVPSKQAMDRADLLARAERSECRAAELERQAERARENAERFRVRAQALEGKIDV